jgi:hypothetical protein
MFAALLLQAAWRAESDVQDAPGGWIPVSAHVSCFSAAIGTPRHASIQHRIRFSLWSGFSRVRVFGSTASAPIGDCPHTDKTEERDRTRKEFQKIFWVFWARSRSAATCASDAPRRASMPWFQAVTTAGST